MPRFFRIELQMGSHPLDDQTRKLRSSMGALALVETPNHGSLSIDGGYSPGTSDGTLTLRQRGIPLDGQGVLNIEAGVVDQSLLPLNRVPTRVAIPSSTLRGLSVEWLTPSDGSQLLLSSGTPGRLEPTPGSGFFRSQADGIASVHSGALEHPMAWTYPCSMSGGARWMTL